MLVIAIIINNEIIPNYRRDSLCFGRYFEQQTQIMFSISRDTQPPPMTEIEN